MTALFTCKPQSHSFCQLGILAGNKKAMIKKGHNSYYMIHALYPYPPKEFCIRAEMLRDTQDTLSIEKTEVTS